MAIIRQKIWYVCDKCNEWFHYPDYKIPDNCPDCNKGVLIKTCAYCGEESENCKCADRQKKIELNVSDKRSFRSGENLGESRAD